MAKKTPTPKVETAGPESQEGFLHPEAPSWNLNIFDLAPEGDPDPQVGDWVSFALDEQIVIQSVIHVQGAKVFVSRGRVVLAQDVIEIR